MKTSTIRATYGNGNTPCNVFTLKTRKGTWYAVEGSTIANLTAFEVREGENIEELPDINTLTVSEPITSEDGLIEAVGA